MIIQVKRVNELKTMLWYVDKKKEREKRSAMTVLFILNKERS